MLMTNGTLLTILCAIILGFVVFSVVYAYRTNAKRAADDPEKRDFAPYAVLLAPVTFPLLVLLNALFVLLFSLMFAVFLVLFPFTLLLFRKPFLIQWFLKQAVKTGNELLQVNTSLLRVTGFYRPSPV